VTVVVVITVDGSISGREEKGKKGGWDERWGERVKVRGRWRRRVGGVVRE
jgi:hypothetical protein